MTSIGEGAFEGCTSLASVTYGGTAAERAALQGSGWSTSGNDPLFDAEWTYLGTVSVTGVTINAESIEITRSETQQLTATVVPADAEDPSVVWSSSDETVATVDQTGLVTAVAPGVATITVTTNDGGFTAECVVTVVRGVIDSGSCGAQGNNVTWTLYENGELVISGTGDMASGSSHSWDNEAITSVSIEYGVTSIGDLSFYNCGNITTVSMPESVTKIGYAAFSHCSNLTDIVFGPNISSIGSQAFSGCTSLNGISIPDGVTEIGSAAFQSCSSLTNISIPSNVTTISDNLFNQCSSLNEVALSEGIVSIGWNAFHNCRNLSTINLPESLKSIGKTAFHDCTTLEEITLPSGLTNIGESAFANTAIKCISIPVGMKKIDDYAFSWCNALTSITIHNSVSSIGTFAFYHCISLPSITIPDSVKSIGEKAFNTCNALTDVYFDGNEIAWNNIDIQNDNDALFAAFIHFDSHEWGEPSYVWSDDNLSATATRVCANNASHVETETVETTLDVIAEPTITTPGSGVYTAVFTNTAFETQTKEVELLLEVLDTGYCGAEGNGDNLTWTLYEDGELIISGSGAMADYSTNSLVPWYDYTNLITSVDISSNATSIGDFAFCNLRNLPTVTIPDSVSSIGKNAFSGCTSLSAINIPNEITAIKDYTFSSCSSLTTITIPASVKSIGIGAFSNDYRLEEVIGMTGVATIGENAFYACNALEEITLSTGLTGLGKFAFAYCNALKSVSLPAGVTSMGEGVFYYCTALESVILPSSLTSIVYHTFFNCTSLTSVTIPKGITTVEQYAFYGCNSLENVYFAGTHEQWNQIEIQQGNEPLTSAAIHYSEPPTITTQPEDVSAVVGSAVTFTVAAEGEEICYQWYYQKPGASAWTANTTNPTASTASLTVTAKAVLDGYKYRCEVSNAVGSVYSDAVTLRAASAAPTITTPPTDVSAVAGNTVSFTVAAKGGGLSYRWYYQKPGTNTWIAATNSTAMKPTFKNTAKTALDGYKYRCEISNALGNIYSDAVTLRVASASPTITAQPTSVSVESGSVFSYTVAAKGGGLSYRWYYQKPGTNTWVAATNSTAAKPTFKNTAKASLDGYSYRCEISNAAGSIWSNTVTLNVSSASPTITTQPASVSVEGGSAFSFTVIAKGGGLSYQWYYQKPGANTWTAATSSSATSATFKNTAKTALNGYKYRCVVSNELGTVTSASVILTVTQSRPTITAQPADISVETGSRATFTVAASGNSLSFQWYYQKPGASAWTANTTNPTASTASLTVTAKAALDGYKYRCEVSNAVGSVYSDAVTLRVASASPTITAQPVSVSASAGDPATFTVIASGGGLLYQWYYQKTGSSTWTANTANATATTATLKVTAKAVLNGYKYRCVVSNALGKVTSSTVTLTVS